jgi:hypothetical protein
MPCSDATVASERRVQGWREALGSLIHAALLGGDELVR